MKRNSTTSVHNKKDYRKNFLVLPGIFLLCGYLIIYLAFLPAAQPLVSAYHLAFTGNTSSPDTDSGETNSIFSGATGISGGDIKASEMEFPRWGDHFGNITMDGTKIDAPLIFGSGSDTDLLKKGACVSFYCGIPGYRKLIMISAHNNTHFSDLQKSGKVGALVHIETNYGSYVYRVVDKKIAHRTDESAYNNYLNPPDGQDKEFLIVYTCQKENGISLSKYRCYVYCEYVSGPTIDKYN